MIGLLIRGAVNLARTINYAVPAGWARIVLLERILPLTGLRAPESSIDCRVLGVIIVVSTLVSVASRLVFATGQPAVLTCAKAGHEGG